MPDNPWKPVEESPWKPVEESPASLGNPGTKPGKHPSDSLGGPPPHPLSWGEKFGGGVTSGLIAPFGAPIERLADAGERIANIPSGLWNTAKGVMSGDPETLGNLVGSAPAAYAMGEMLPKGTGSVVKGATRGAFEDSLAPSSLHVGPLRVKVPVPAVASGAFLGHEIGQRLFGHPGGIAGGMIGGGAPLVRGAIRGGREAMENLREPAPVATQAPTPIIPPSRQVTEGSIKAGPVTDTSGPIPNWQPTVLDREPATPQQAPRVPLQLTEGSIKAAPVTDASGVIPGWSPTILEHEPAPFMPPMFDELLNATRDKLKARGAIPESFQFERDAPNNRIRERWDEGGPSPTVQSTTSRTTVLRRPAAGSPLENNPKGLLAAQALAKAMKRK